MTEPMSAEEAYRAAFTGWKAHSGMDGWDMAFAIIQQYGDQRVAAALARLDDPALVEVVARDVYAKHPLKVITREQHMRLLIPMGDPIPWDTVLAHGGNHNGLLTTISAALAAIKEKLNGPA